MQPAKFIPPDRGFVFPRCSLPFQLCPRSVSITVAGVSNPSIHSAILFAAIATKGIVNLQRSCHNLSNHQFSPTIIDLNYYCF